METEVTLTPLLGQTEHGMVSPHTFSVVSFRRRRRLLIQKRKRKSKIAIFHYRTSLMKLAIGILILDRPPDLAISWPCFKRMVILSITTYLIPYNHFLSFFSLLGTVAIKWTNSSGVQSIVNQLIDNHESMIENYCSFFSFLSGVNSNASSQALPTGSRLRPRQFYWISLEPKRRSCER